MQAVLAQVIQQFSDWTKKKIFHHVKENDKYLYFREKEVWWAALGKNVGYEMDGKHEFFTRPVLILKKYSATMCFVVPLTTKIKFNNPSYQYRLDVHGKQSALNLSQGRTISSKRLTQRIGSVDETVFNEILNTFIQLLLK